MMQTHSIVLRDYSNIPRKEYRCVRSYIVGTTPFDRHFIDRYIVPLKTLDPSALSNFELHAIYQESCRQVFDCMCNDFMDFEAKLKLGPKFALMINQLFFQSHPEIQPPFRQGYYEFGLQLYFTVLHLGLCMPTSQLILSWIGNGCVGCDSFEEF